MKAVQRRILRSSTRQALCQCDRPSLRTTTQNLSVFLKCTESDLAMTIPTLLCIGVTQVTRKGSWTSFKYFAKLHVSFIIHKHRFWCYKHKSTLLPTSTWNMRRILSFLHLERSYNDTSWDILIKPFRGLLFYFHMAYLKGTQKIDETSLYISRLFESPRRHNEMMISHNVTDT